jgi:hypothetical protein
MGNTVGEKGIGHLSNFDIASIPEARAINVAHADRRFTISTSNGRNRQKYAADY